ncbi:MAG: hypothetical protein V3V99_12395 [candidate division Zixibacteria bacterium]
MTSTAKNETTHYKQKGIYEKLLCDVCEQHINEFEKHVKIVFFDDMNYQDTGEPNQIKIVNLNYEKFKLFQLSLIWRASVSSDDFFKNVSLGPHQEIIRKMILQKKPGAPHDYGCLIIGLELEKNASFDAIAMPKKGRFENLNCYMFTIGGCIWQFIISRQSHLFSHKKDFLQKDGSLLIRIIPANAVPSINSFAKNLLHSGKVSDINKMINK